MIDFEKPTHAVFYKNNWDGQGDTEYLLVVLKDGEYFSYETGTRLLQYIGDEILKQWELKWLSL